MSRRSLSVLTICAAATLAPPALSRQSAPPPATQPATPPASSAPAQPAPKPADPNAPAPAASRPAAAPAEAIDPRMKAPVIAVKSDANLFSEQTVADLIARLALQRIRQVEDPKADDYRVTALALAAARRLLPDDPELIRQQIEAWEGCGDTARINAATVDLVKLDPKDTVAWLRLLTSRMMGLQDADQRLAAYDKLTKLDSIDRSVRSRLALDAALLARENGQQRDFLNSLTFATTLDPSNKEAAALYATVFLDLTTDPRERLDISLNLLLADPFDPEVMRNVAFELRGRGAFEAAFRFLKLARTLAGGDMPTTSMFDYQLGSLDAQGPDVTLVELQRMIDVQQLSETMRWENQKKRGKDPGAKPVVRLPTILERIRLLVRVAQSDDASAATSMDSIEYTVNEDIESIKAKANEEASSGKAEENVTPENRPGAKIRQLMAERLWMRIFAGISIDKAEADLAILDKPGENGEPPMDEKALQRFAGWIFAVKGNLAEAKKLLEPLADSDQWALWALALVAQKEGDSKKALAIYEQLGRESNATGLGSAARIRWQRIKGEPLPESAGAKELNRQAMAFAPWLEGMIEDPHSYLSLDIKNDRSMYGALDRECATLTLRSGARIPLALGPNRPISPRMLISPKLIARGADLSSKLYPEVIMMSRRLRLTPGESVSARVIIPRMDLGIKMDYLVNSPLSLRIGVIQGFVLLPPPQSQFVEGPNSIRAESEICTRLPLPELANADITADQLLKLQGAALSEPWAVTCSTLTFSDKSNPQDVSTLTAALIKRLATMNGLERASVIARLVSNGAFKGELRTRILAAIGEDKDPAVVTVLAISCNDPEEKDLIEPLRKAAAGDADLTELVQKVADILDKRSSKDKPAAGDAPAAGAAPSTPASPPAGAASPAPAPAKPAPAGGEKAPPK